MNLARAREFIDQIVRFYLAIQQRATDSCIIAAFSNLQKDEKNMTVQAPTACCNRESPP